jgi:hypothetical protein
MTISSTYYARIMAQKILSAKEMKRLPSLFTYIFISFIYVSKICSKYFGLHRYMFVELNFLSFSL